MKSISSLRFLSRLFSFLVIASLLIQTGFTTPVLATSQASLQIAPFTACADMTEIPQAECEALVALYNSTNGAGWSTNTDWLTTDTPCSWYGVECGGDHVTKLRLGANQLSGSIPMELGNLTQLTEVGLEFNQLTGSIPANIGNLTQLTWLNLAFNQLTGSIPADIGNLTQLTELYLFYNQLSGEFPGSITNLVNLTTLRYDCWLTSSDPVVIAFLNEKSAYQCAPNLQALPDEEQVSGENWTLGKTVTIEIDDPATQDVNPDHTGQAVVGIADWDPQKTWFGFYFIGEYNLKPGDLVTVSDNTTTKTHTVTSLAITNINPDINMVSGTTNTGGSVDIWICDENNCVVRKEPVDQNGNWSANFGEPGDEGGEEDTFDIQSYTWVDAAQYDQERDSTQVNWSVPNEPNPTLGVNPDGVWGIDWILGTSVTLTVDDPANGTGVDYTATETVQMYDFPKPTAVFHLPLNFEIQPGFELTMTDGTTTKTHTAVYFQISNVDVATDIVSGVTEAGAQVQVWMNKGERTVTAGSDGIWSADFKIPGDPPNEDDIVDILPGDFLMASVHDVDGDSTGDWANAPSPYLSARIPDNTVSGRDWTLGESVALTIDDPETSQVVDYSETRTVVPWDWDPSQTEARFNLNSFLLKPGQVLTMTNGTVTKVHTIIDLKITDVNIDTDTVSGTTNVLEGEIQIYSFGNPPTNRIINVNSDGTWLADFSVPHSSQNNISDLRPGDVSEALHYDEDGDFTLARWIVPEPPNFHVRPNQNQIHAFRWLEGNLVHLTVDDPTTPNPIDYEETQEAVMTEWFNDMTFMIFKVEGMTLHAGQIVTMTDGTMTKSHVIQELSVTGANPVTNIVEGSAAPNAFVHVWESCDQDVCAFRYIQADSNGVWLADFSIPGSNSSPEEQKTLDFQPGSNGNANIRDEDGDFTTWNWRVPNPMLGVHFPQNNIHSYGWLLGETVTLTVDDPNNGAGIDYTEIQTVVVPEWNPNETFAEFLPGAHNFELQPGQLVTVTNGTIARTHIITTVQLTNINPDDDTVSGTAQPGVWISVQPHCSDCPNRQVQTDASGSWLADFSILSDPDDELFNILPGMGIAASQRDDDGDATYAWGNLTYPTFNVRANGDQIESYQWDMGDTLTLEIDNPTTIDNPDYTATKTVTDVADWDPSQTYVPFDLSSVYDIQIGDMISISNGAITKETIVTNLAITDVHLDTDIVEGIAEPNQTINDETANQSGHWTANFAIPGEKDWEQGMLDIRSGSWIDSSVEDEDGDSTMFGWNVSSAPIADAGPDQTALEADTVTLDASASSDPESGLLTYEWDLDADGEYDDAVDVTTSTTFPDNGNYIVGLKVTNQYGESDTDTAEITVANISPTVAIQQAVVNNLGVLSGNGLFTDPGADIWNASVNYGDGTITQSLALNPDKSFSLSHTYSTSGDYTIEVCVSDDDEGSGCDQLQVTVVTNQPPIADAGGPYSGNEGTTINLNASKSTDPDNSIVLYEWDLDNDGQFDDATGKKPKFKAIDNGIFTVSVQVTDAGGLSSVDSARVTVRNVPPIITSLSFNILVRVGVNVNARATFKDTGVNDTFTATWKWGDGTTSIGTVVDNTVTGSHTYTKPGVYLVTVMVKDNDGGTGLINKLIVVLPKR